MTSPIGTTRRLEDLVREQTQQCLAAYRAKPNLVEQDAGIEISSVEGGYGRKQLFELVQNSADALRAGSGRIALVLTPTHLYCANEGESLTERGIEALMASHISIKRDDQIGRFGLGFKSVLGITDAPEIISRSVAIRFDREWAADLIRSVSPMAGRTPVLRVAQVVDPRQVVAQDGILGELLRWATTVVRIPLKEQVEWLRGELDAFPPEFLLFAPQVRQLDIVGGVRHARTTWTAERSGDRVSLIDSTGKRVDWHVFEQLHHPSANALRDAGELTGRADVRLSWAVPLKSRSRAGQFWAYFPTQSRTTLSGIINAPFKTNEDRHDILDGAYNREILTQVLPDLVAEHMDVLVDPADPASVLDLLPARGKEIRSWADDALNNPVMYRVAARPCLPNLDQKLCEPTALRLMPEFLAERSRYVQRWLAHQVGHPIGSTSP